MSCSPFDLKDYFLQELPSPDRVQVEAHVNHCLTCREELERLQLPGAAWRPSTSSYPGGRNVCTTTSCTSPATEKTLWT